MCHQFNLGWIYSRLMNEHLSEEIFSKEKTILGTLQQIVRKHTPPTYIYITIKIKGNDFFCGRVFFT